MAVNRQPAGGRAEAPKNMGKMAGIGFSPAAAKDRQ
jgi:hypothetical protein